MSLVKFSQNKSFLEHCVIRLLGKIVDYLVNKKSAGACWSGARAAVRTEDWRAPCRWSGSRAHPHQPSLWRVRCRAAHSSPQHPRCTLCSARRCCLPPGRPWDAAAAAAAEMPLGTAASLASIAGESAAASAPPPQARTLRLRPYRLPFLARSFANPPALISAVCRLRVACRPHTLLLTEPRSFTRIQQTVV